MRTRLCSKCQKPKTREEFRPYWWHRPWGCIIYFRLCKTGGEMDTAGFKFAKPGDVGRTKVVKLSKAGYASQRRTKWEMQGRACTCGKGISLEQGELHHKDGRGLGGGKRNDLRTVMLCQDCHRKKHNQ